MKRLIWWMVRHPSPGRAAAAGAEGYSPPELRRAGISEAQARAMGLTVDRARRSVLGSKLRDLRTLAGGGRSAYM